MGWSLSQSLMASRTVQLVNRYGENIDLLSLLPSNVPHHYHPMTQPSTLKLRQSSTVDHSLMAFQGSQPLTSTRLVWSCWRALNEIITRDVSIAPIYTYHDLICHKSVTNLCGSFQEFAQVRFGISFVGYQVYLLALIAYHDKSGPDMGMGLFLMYLLICQQYE